jgi:hypothetical protein
MVVGFYTLSQVDKSTVAGSDQDAAMRASGKVWAKVK